MKVAVVGSGTAGASAALLLARDGHEVEIFERVPDPRPVGAGILLQPLGQRILDTLGLGDELAAASTAVRRIEGRAGGPDGRYVLRFGYQDAGSAHRRDQPPALRRRVGLRARASGSIVRLMPTSSQTTSSKLPVASRTIPSTTGEVAARP